MSHDRGCFRCGNDRWDYASCTQKDCPKKDLYAGLPSTKRTYTVLRNTPNPTPEPPKRNVKLPSTGATIDAQMLSLLLDAYINDTVTIITASTPITDKYVETVRFWLNNENPLIEQTTGNETLFNIRLTERGLVFVESVLKTPWPVAHVTWKAGNEKELSNGS